MAASLVRLHFHDYFVGGCDTSILLKQSSSITSEQLIGPNANSSLRGFEVIETAKQVVERVCPGVVSCADILTLAASYASAAVHGPIWGVRLGRRDSTTSHINRVNFDLPHPSSSINELIFKFSAKGLNKRDMVALTGAHSIGQARCSSFRSRIYSYGADLEPRFAAILQHMCPRTGGDRNLASQDMVTPNTLDNWYYTNLVQRRGLLQSDQILFSEASTRNIVIEFSTSPTNFYRAFEDAMFRMSEIQPLSGQNGIIRRVCSAIN